MAPGKVCLTDPESAVLKYKEGASGPGYNVQVAADADTGMILSVEATTDKTDAHQLTRQTKNVGEMLDSLPGEVGADAGYHVADEFAAMDALGVKAYCPDRNNPQNSADKPFSAQKFRYDQQRDVMVCPAGRELRFVRVEAQKAGKTRRCLIRIYRGGPMCLDCVNFGQCTESKRGRTVKRLENEPARQRAIERASTERGAEVLSKRKRIEHRMSDIKNLRGIRRVLVKGRDKTTQFLLLLAMSINLDRAYRMMSDEQHGLLSARPRNAQHPRSQAHFRAHHLAPERPVLPLAARESSFRFVLPTSVNPCRRLVKRFWSVLGAAFALTKLAYAETIH